MKHEFNMTNLDKMRYFLGLKVLHKFDSIYVNQNRYAFEILHRFRMDKNNLDFNLIAPGYKLMKDKREVKVDKTYYKQIIGSLMYLITTEPNLMFVVSIISRYMENPT